MTATLHKISPIETRKRLDAGTATLIDIREPDEFARGHIKGARPLPLSQWDSAHIQLDPDTEVIFTCGLGMRTASACDRLTTRVAGPAFVLDGGVNAWKAAGLPTEGKAGAPLEIMRQVQIAAGSLVLLGMLMGFLVSTGWFGLVAFVGAGLVFAGVTGTCGMAKLLMLLPWNHPRPA